MIDALTIWIALAGWSVLIRLIDQRFVLHERVLAALFFGGAFLVIFLALRAGRGI